MIGNEPQETSYLVSISYSKWTNDDKEIGEPGERGIELEKEELDADELRQYIDRYGFAEASSSDPEVGKIWFSSNEPREDREHFELGIDAYFELHIHEVNGHAPTPDDYRQIADMIGVKFREPKPELADADNGFSPT